jgi:hypothetical protein
LLIFVMVMTSSTGILLQITLQPVGEVAGVAAARKSSGTLNLQLCNAAAQRNWRDDARGPPAWRCAAACRRRHVTEAGQVR